MENGSHCVNDTGLPAGGGTRDYANEFKTTKFKSEKELIKYACEVGKLYDFSIITLRSDSSGGRRKPRVTLGCERSGKCDARKPAGRKVKSKKCGCPFRLMGKYLAAGDEWELIIVEGKHNHEAGDIGGQGHSFKGRLSQEEKSLLEDMHIKGKKAREILTTLKENNRHNKSTIRTIYNEIQSLNRRLQKQRLLDNNLQRVLSKAEEYFIEEHRKIDDRVSEFVLIHHMGLKLLRAFPTVLLINYYGLKLLRAFPTVLLINYYGFDHDEDYISIGMDTLWIGGVTSSNNWFFVAVAFLYSSSSNRACESSVEWGLSTLRGVMNDNGISMPDVVLSYTTFCETPSKLSINTAMQPIHYVFSPAKIVFPTEVIQKDISHSFWSIFYTAGLREKLKLFMESSTEVDLEKHMKELRSEFDMYPEVIDYIQSYWMPYKEMFVQAWTDKIMHFGNINRKRRWWLDCFPFSCSDILECFDRLFTKAAYYQEQEQSTEIDEDWKDIHGVIERESVYKYGEIKVSFEESLLRKNNSEETELKELYGKVSIHALGIIREQSTLLPGKVDIDDDHSDCSCAIKCTHGLPCAHEIAKYKRQGRPIPLECIHSHWKTLPLDIFPTEESEESEESEENEDMDTDYRESEEMNVDTNGRNSAGAGPSIMPLREERQPKDKDIDSVMEAERPDIKASFEKFLTNKYNDEDGLPESKELHEKIAIYASQIIGEQTLLADIVTDDHFECSCPIKRYGLPCAHVIAKYKRQGRPISLECIHSNFTKLEFNILELFTRQEMNTDTHNDSALSLPDIVESERNSLNAGPSILPSPEEGQPEDKVHDILKIEQSKLLDVFPPLLRPYISKITDVPRDGHCGFRAIASLIGYGTDNNIGWLKVREDLCDELQQNLSYYCQLFGSDKRVYELQDALKYFESPCPRKHWMTMPDMGHIISYCYNVVLVHLSSRSDQCFTFFPLRTAPISISKSPPSEIVIGFAHEHFVQVYWKEVFLNSFIPMPPPIPTPTKKNPHEESTWETFHKQRSIKWADAYLSRIDHFKCLYPEVVSQNNPIVIDIDQ